MHPWGCPSRTARTTFEAGILCPNSAGSLLRWRRPDHSVAALVVLAILIAAPGLIPRPLAFAPWAAIGALALEVLYAAFPLFRYRYPPHRLLSSRTQYALVRRATVCDPFGRLQVSPLMKIADRLAEHGHGAVWTLRVCAVQAVLDHQLPCRTFLALDGGTCRVRTGATPTATCCPEWDAEFALTVPAPRCLVRVQVQAVHSRPFYSPASGGRD